MKQESTKSLRTALYLLATVIFANHVLLCEGANILFFIGFGSPSHRIAVQPLAETLAAKGHNVTFLVHEKPKEKDSAVQYFVPEKLSQHFTQVFRGDNRADFYQIRATGKQALGSIFIPSFGIKVCDKLYNDPKVKDWLRTTKFNLVIIDSLFNDCGYAIAHLHKAKTIVFSVSSFLPWTPEAFGVPDQSSTIPDMWFQFGPNHDLSFFQRALTAVVPLYWKLFRGWYYFPAMNRVTREALGMPDFPSFADLEKNTSLVLVNTHVSQEYPRSLPSNVVTVGGISWVEKKKEIPKVCKSKRD